jgi:hypothetical protein
MSSNYFNPTLKGALAELAVACKFLKKGYYVSRPLDPSCPFDLVITDKKGVNYLIDVKSISYRKKDKSIINRCLTTLQKQLKIRLYFTNINGLSMKEIKNIKNDK